MPYKFAFVMDPLEKVLPDKDTTFAFMLEAIGRGHQAYFVALPTSMRSARTRLPGRGDAR